MALIECPECKRAISDRADACPGCGYPIATDVAGSANKGPAPQQSPKPTKDQAKDQDPVKLSDSKAPTENIADKEMAWMTPLWSAFMACLAWVVGRIGTAVVYAITGVKAVPLAQSAFPFSATYIAILWVPLSIWVVLFMLMNVKPNRELRAEEQAATAEKKRRAAATKQERRAAAAEKKRLAAAAEEERLAAAAEEERLAAAAEKELLAAAAEKGRLAAAAKQERIAAAAEKDRLAAAARKKRRQAAAAKKRREEAAVKKRDGLNIRVRIPKTADDFEMVCVEWMRKGAFPDAERTPKGPDGGIDALASDAVGQAKFHPSQKVTAESVRALAGSKVERRKKRALFFHYGPGYTPDAIEAANKTRVELYDLDVDTLRFKKIN